SFSRDWSSVVCSSGLSDAGLSWPPVRRHRPVRPHRWPGKPGVRPAGPSSTVTLVIVLVITAVITVVALVVLPGTAERPPHHGELDGRSVVRGDDDRHVLTREHGLLEVHQHEVIPAGFERVLAARGHDDPAFLLPHRRVQAVTARSHLVQLARARDGGAQALHHDVRIGIVGESPEDGRHVLVVLGGLDPAVVQRQRFRRRGGIGGGGLVRPLSGLGSTAPGDTETRDEGEGQAADETGRAGTRETHGRLLRGKVKGERKSATRERPAGRFGAGRYRDELRRGGWRGPCHPDTAARGDDSIGGPRRKTGVSNSSRPPNTLGRRRGRTVSTGVLGDGGRAGATTVRQHQDHTAHSRCSPRARRTAVTPVTARWAPAISGARIDGSTP